MRPTLYLLHHSRLPNINTTTKNYLIRSTRSGTSDISQISTLRPWAHGRSDSHQISYLGLQDTLVFINLEYLFWEFLTFRATWIWYMNVPDLTSSFDNFTVLEISQFIAYIIISADIVVAIFITIFLTSTFCAILTWK